MTNVIAFHPKRGETTAGLVADRDVTILFFTGVRYVREAEAEHDPLAVQEPERQLKDAGARTRTERKKA